MNPSHPDDSLVDSPRASMIASSTLVLVTLCALGRLCICDFTWWDDQGTVHHNPWLNPTTLASFTHYWTHSEYGLYIPVTYDLWACLTLIARVAPDQYGTTLNPWVFHAANLLVHVGSALLVYRILRVLNADLIGSLCGALLFAVHPIQVEAVGWISGLKDVLSGVLALAALLSYALFARSDLEGEQRPGRFILATFLFILAMLAKPATLTLPLLAVALDRWVIERPWRKILPLARAWVALSVPVGAWAMHVQNAENSPMVALWAKPFIAADALAFYFSKLLMPVHFAVEYGRSPVEVLLRGCCYWDWVFPAGLAAFLVPGAKRRPVLLAAGIVFVGGCLAVLGFARTLFQQFSTTTDHYLYVSMLGPALALAWVLSVYPKRWLRAVAATALFMLAVLSFRQTSVWQDDVTLFEQCTRVNPRSYVGWINLGGAYQRIGQLQKAITCFRRSVEARSDYPLSHSDLADVLYDTGDEAGAIQEKMESVRLQTMYPTLRPAWPDDQEKLGRILADHGRLAEAIPYLQAAVDIAPENPEYRKLLEDAQKKTSSTQPVSRHVGG